MSEKGTFIVGKFETVSSKLNRFNRACDQVDRQVSTEFICKVHGRYIAESRLSECCIALDDISGF